MEYKCNKCNILFKNNGACIRHQNNCNLNTSIIEEYNSGLSLTQLSINYKSTFTILRKFLEDNNVRMRTEEETRMIMYKIKPRCKPSDETKLKISEKRKQYLKENPDKHPWKKNTKFKSAPCENFKKVLDGLSIKYLPEHSPSDERSFSIDISLPQYKIAIEVNGNQHYNKDGSLKPYYQERHDFISNLGYKVYELHYSLFFNEEKMTHLIRSIIDNKPLEHFDYDKYLLESLNKPKNKSFCSCGIQVWTGNNRCKKCFDKSREKLDRPPLEQLLKQVEELGYCGTGRKYGVSDTSIRKWIKKILNEI